VERNRKAGQNPPRVVASTEEEDTKGTVHTSTVLNRWIPWTHRQFLAFYNVCTVLRDKTVTAKSNQMQSPNHNTASPTMYLLHLITHTDNSP